MTVYLLWMWGDDYKYIHSIFANKEKCEEYKEELEKEDIKLRQLGKMCNDCKASVGSCTKNLLCKDCEFKKYDDNCMKLILNSIPKECNHAQICKDKVGVDSYMVSCNNYYSHDNTYYKIEPIEVIE